MVGERGVTVRRRINLGYGDCLVLSKTKDWVIRINAVMDRGRGRKA
jgi:hypothetical protein